MDSASHSVQTNNYSASKDNHTLRADDLFRQALGLHQEGKIALAISLYQQAHDLDPQHIETCFYLALLYSGSDNSTEAIIWLKKAHALAPSEQLIICQLGIACLSSGQEQSAINYFQKVLELDASNWEAAYNLGATYFASGETAKAIEAYHQAANYNPHDADIHFNLGLACKKAGYLAEAMEAYHCALEIAQDDADIHYNLAIIYKKLGDQEEAANTLEIALLLRPDFGAALGHLGVLYMALDKVSQAIACYEKLIELDHNATDARHMIAALTGKTTASAPFSYIKNLFNDFSDHFEERLLVDLEYQTPWALEKMLIKNTGTHIYERLLDLGCGTGLIGQIFKDVAKSKTGVDLSPKMIDAAKKKNVYDHLLEDDIINFLQQTTATFDLIIACDTLIYLGEMGSLFSLLSQRLSNKGTILLSTEYYQDKGYKLQPSGRYAHSQSYIQGLAKANGLKIMAVERANLRKEKGEWIIGDLYLLTNCDTD